MKIIYANQRVEKYFTDFAKMKKKLPIEWIRIIKKHLDRLEAAECFGDFLSLGLGHPERLSETDVIRYSLRVTANVRLIIELDAMDGNVRICELVEVKGVNDYHGSKDNWYIS